MEALEVAKYLIAKSDNVGDIITNKKLQKILYYVKAWGVVYFTDGIIDDDFEAWIHGPVCVKVYNYFKDKGYSPLSIEYKGTSSSKYIESFKNIMGKDERSKSKIELIDAVFEKYSPMSSLSLELLTHSEKPWKDARNGLTPTERGNNVIDVETMKNFYGEGKVKPN